MSRLFDDVPGFLRALQEAQITTALVTNSSVRAQMAKLEAVGLESAFAAVVISGEIGIAKPDPAIFAVAVDRLQLTPSDVCHIGDSLSTDVAGALASGISSVWLNRSRRELGPSDPHPDLQVTSLRELPALLLGGPTPGVPSARATRSSGR
jgi:putative hydrolase of the HAD superfamily